MNLNNVPKINLVQKDVCSPKTYAFILAVLVSRDDDRFIKYAVRTQSIGPGDKKEAMKAEFYREVSKADARIKVLLHGMLQFLPRDKLRQTNEVHICALKGFHRKYPKHEILARILEESFPDFDMIEMMFSPH